MSEIETRKRFPYGGPRQPVYDFMRGLGFTMAQFSDKSWTSSDKITVQIYGAGSMARISIEDVYRGNCELDKLPECLDALRIVYQKARIIT